MMAQTFVYNSGESEVSKHEIQIECGIFFDGTLNSKYNTLLRTMVKEGKPRKATEEEKISYYKGSKRNFIDQQGVDNSYSNDYTNVARLWEYCAPDYRIYIEGIGIVLSTESEKLEKQMSTGDQDDGDGFMFGAGKAGIRAKVRKACKILAERIKNEKKKYPVELKNVKVTLDVFGFSRGAAAARSFVHEVNVMKSYLVLGYLQEKAAESFKKSQEKKSSLELEWKIAKRDGIPSDPIRLEKQRLLLDHDGEEIPRYFLDGTNGRLPKMGHLGYMLMKNGLTFEEVENTELIVRFVGVYDTVSSYYKEKSKKNYLVEQLHDDGKGNKYFADDVKELHLNDLGKVGNAVHFTAMDEHRYNFALTKMPGAIEREFPGVHCDIGGAYLNEKEYVDEIEVAVDSDDETRNQIFKRPDSEKSKNKAIQSLIMKFKRGYYGPYAKIRLHKYANQLIDNHWYQLGQLSVNDINSFTYEGKLYKTKGWYYKLSGTRNLRKEYSYIPLLFMGEYFKKQLGNKSLQKCFEQHDKFNQKFSVDKIDVLKKAKNHLNSYVMTNKGMPWKYLSSESIRISNEILEKKKKRLKDISDKRQKEKISNKDEIVKQDGQLYKIQQDKIQKVQIGEDLLQRRFDEMEDRHTKLMYAQGVLEVLRNEYLHWSANKDWFGMQPTSDRTRKKY